MSTDTETTEEKSLTPVVEGEEDRAFELESKDLKSQLESQVEEPLLTQVKRLAYYIGRVGLSLEESCILVDLDYTDFTEKLKLHPAIQKVINVKELEYKKDLLATLSKRARSGDDKMSMWLLERRYPQEFGTKKRVGGGEDDGLIFEAIEFIQKHGDSTPLVGETAGRAISIRRQGTNKSLIQKVEDVLK